MERLIAIVIVALVAAGNVFAGGTEQLRNFLSATQAVRGKFDQTITDQNGKVVRQTSGTLEFSRPGKFRWEYGTPFKQTIVGDGEKVWLYDPDLNQVTVRKIDDAIGSSPAALLAGDAAIEKNFTLKDGGVEGKREWVEATPAFVEQTVAAAWQWRARRRRLVAFGWAAAVVLVAAGALLRDGTQRQVSCFHIPFHAAQGRGCDYAEVAGASRV